MGLWQMPKCLTEFLTSNVRLSLPLYGYTTDGLLTHTVSFTSGSGGEKCFQENENAQTSKYTNIC